jgi:hypothetical protein
MPVTLKQSLARKSPERRAKIQAEAARLIAENIRKNNPFMKSLGRPKTLDNMSAAEITVMEARVKRARIIKENHHKDMLRAAITKMVKENGFRVEDII